MNVFLKDKHYVCTTDDIIFKRGIIYQAGDTTKGILPIPHEYRDEKNILLLELRDIAIFISTVDFRRKWVCVENEMSEKEQFVLHLSGKLPDRLN